MPKKEKEEVTETPPVEAPTEPKAELPVTEIKLQTEAGETVALSAEQIQQIIEDNKALRRDKHQMAVRALVSKAEQRGVVPAVTRLAEHILLACEPQAQPTIKLEADGEEKDYNLYSAVARLLEVVPSVTETLTKGVEGVKLQAAPKLSTDEAEAKVKEDRKRLASYMGRPTEEASI